MALNPKWFYKKTGERFAKVSLEFDISADMIEKIIVWIIDVCSDEKVKMLTKAEIERKLRAELYCKGMDAFGYFWENQGTQEDGPEHKEAKEIAKKLFPDFYEKVEVARG